MRIAIVTSRPVPYDAISNFIADSARALTELGEVVVYTLAWDREPVQGVRVRHMGVENTHSLKSNLVAMWNAPELAEELAGFDVLLLNNPDIGQFAACQRAQKLNPRLKLAWSFTGITPNKYMPTVKDRVLATIRWSQYLPSMRKAAGIHVFSPWTAGELGLRDVPADKIKVIPYGVDVERFASADGAGVRRKHGLSGFVVLYVGRLVKHKKVDEIVRAVNLIPDASLLIVGNGPERDSLDHLSTRVVFAGTVADEDLPSYYKAGDVLALASRHEGFSVPIAEAMAAGLPVVAPLNTAMPLTMGTGGATYQTGSIVELSQRLRALMNPATREITSKNAIEVSKNYERGKTLAAFVNFVREL